MAACEMNNFPGMRIRASKLRNLSMPAEVGALPGPSRAPLRGESQAPRAPENDADKPRNLFRLLVSKSGENADLEFREVLAKRSPLHGQSERRRSHRQQLPERGP